MKILNHRLCLDDGTPVDFVKSPNTGSALSARFLVMHYTAGSSAESSIRHLAKKSAKASAHLVISRSGEITQMVPFNRVAWHAGRSRWHNIRGLNQHSIGIELDNAGPLEGGSGVWRAWFGREYEDSDVVVASHKFDSFDQGWHVYTEAQIAAALAAAEAIVDHYELVDVLGHDDIAPERKRDPGPAFPMESFRSHLIGRADDEFEFFSTTTAVNLREGPGTHYARHPDSPLATGTRLQSELRDGSWHYVDVLDDDGSPKMTGWVHGNFIAPA